MGRELMRVKEGALWGDTCREGMKPKKGAWFQMWQTVSDKPYTPAFETAEELAHWCADHPWGMELDNPIPYETWLKFINGPGWAPSMMGMAGGAVTSGVQAMVDGVASL